MSAAEGKAPDRNSLKGRVFGGYRIAQDIATGGMATVYLGHKSGPGRFSQTSAIKIIHSHMAKDRDFVEMFLDEARIASCINHPNVCRVLDFGKDGGTYYLAMEYLLGETWSRALRAIGGDDDGQRVLPEVIAHVIAQACEGLHAAHEAVDHTGKPLNIVHRDMSPQNLFVGYDGSVRVLDFGIASAAGRLHTTRNGAVKGRFCYMAPEQMRGGETDRRSDLWSLGVILREGLTGKSLFRRDSDAETIYAVSNEPMPEWDVSVPAGLQRVADKALQRDPELRYASAREMGQDLMRFVTSQVVPMGMPEVSVWMNRMFKEDIETKRRVLRKVHDSSQVALPAVALPGAADTNPSATGRTPAIPGSGVDGDPSVSKVRPVEGEIDTDVVVSRIAQPRYTRWIAALVLLAAAGAGFGLYLGEERGPMAPVAQPAPLPAEAAPLPLPVTAPAPAAQVEVETVPADPAEVPTAEAVDEVVVPEPEPAAEREARKVTRKSTRKPRRAKALPPGTVNIVTTNGWAEVYSRGRKLGTTPGRFTLPGGKQTLTLKRMGKGEPQTRVVQVVSGEITRVPIALK